MFLHALKLFIVSYLIFAGLMFVLQRRLLYVPSKSRPSLQKFKGFWEEFRSQTRDGLTLVHWLSKRGRPYVLVFHGNAGNIEDRVYKFKFLADRGYSVLLVSYRGYGGAPGRPSEKSLIDDSARALEALLEREGISASDTVFLGESLGSGVAVSLAAERPVGAVILDGAYSSIADVAQSVYPFLPVRLMLKDRWDSLSRVSKVKAPILFLHSRKDSVLPFRLAKKLYEAANPPKQRLWLDHSGHTDNLESDAVRKALFDFISSVNAGRTQAGLKAGPKTGIVKLKNSGDPE